MLLTHFVKLIENGIRWPGDKYSCSEPEGAGVMGDSWESDAWRLGDKMLKRWHYYRVIDHPPCCYLMSLDCGRFENSPSHLLVQITIPACYCGVQSCESTQLDACPSC